MIVGPRTGDETRLCIAGSRLCIAGSRLARHRYLVSDDFTLADIPFGHVLYRYYEIDIPRTDLPALRRYHDRPTERRAYRAHVMVSYDALKE